MDTLIRAAESLTPVSSEFTKLSGDYKLTREDQHFLLVFIMGTYFGPDVKDENPRKSALQRIAEGLPAYTSDQLTGSKMKMADAEKVYYYALRKADGAFLLKLSFLLHQFFQGNPKNQEMDDDPVGKHPQFPDLFPTHLHPQSYCGGHYIIENVVFINNPETSYMKDIERFKRLSGLQDLILDRNAATCWSVGISSTKDNTKLEDFKGKLPLGMHSMDPLNIEETNCHLKAKPLSSFHHSQSQTKSDSSFLAGNDADIYQDLEDIAGPMLLLSSPPTKQQPDNIVAVSKQQADNIVVVTKQQAVNIVAATKKNGIQYHGSIIEQPVGPLIGLLDIGECEDAYIFHVSLPGVSRKEKLFSCKVETNGQVVIKGVTVTGKKFVNKFSQMFEMKTQNLPPPGLFTVTFKLPGPVDPREFTGNFGEDGILEAIVLKQKS